MSLPSTSLYPTPRRPAGPPKADIYVPRWPSHGPLTQPPPPPLTLWPVGGRRPRAEDCWKERPDPSTYTRPSYRSCTDHRHYAINPLFVDFMRSGLIVRRVDAGVEDIKTGIALGIIDRAEAALASGTDSVPSSPALDHTTPASSRSADDLASLPTPLPESSEPSDDQLDAETVPFAGALLAYPSPMPAGKLSSHMRRGQRAAIGVGEGSNGSTTAETGITTHDPQSLTSTTSLPMKRRRSEAQLESPIIMHKRTMLTPASWASTASESSIASTPATTRRIPAMGLVVSVSSGVGFIAGVATATAGMTLWASMS